MEPFGVEFSFFFLVYLGRLGRSKDLGQPFHGTGASHSENKTLA